MRKKHVFFTVAAIIVAALVIVGCSSQASPSSAPKAASPVASRTVTPMKSGTYLKNVKGMFLGVQVETVLSEKRIESVRVVAHHETEGIAAPAIAAIPAAIVNYQSTEIDVVTGASMTSRAILYAVEESVKEAGGKVEEYWVRTPSSTAILPRDALLKADGTPRGPETTPRSWNETYDIVVVGGGYAGLSAAYAAQTNGAKVLLIEKMPFLGGNSIINGGQIAAYNSKIAPDLYKRLNLTPDTAEKHIEDTFVGGDFMGEIPLIKNMVYGGPFLLDLLIDNGLKLRPTIYRPGGHYGYRTYGLESGQGKDIVYVQAAMAEKAGVKIALNTKLVRIYREGAQSGRVVGIAVYTANGIKTIKTDKALILASGGFGANVEMRSKQVPALTSDIPTTNHVAANGEGILYAQEVGASTMQMNLIQLYPFADANTGVLDVWAVIPFSGPSAGCVYVDYQGKRYVNEGERRDVNARAAQNSGGFPTFTIVGQDILEKVTTQREADAGILVDRVIKADTLEDLARAINKLTFKGKNLNMDPATLAATIAKHNQYVKNGTDPDFGKRIDRGAALTIEKGPYYAVPQWPSVHHTMGGLAVTPKLEVLDLFGKVIPNFFAAGEVAGGVHGTNRLGSNADTDALVNGYIAGYYAVKGDVPAFIQGK